MKHRSTDHIDKFHFHDSGVISYSNPSDSIVVHLKGASLLSSHPMNSELFAQHIEPCTVTFSGPTGSGVDVFLEATKSVVAHPLSTGWIGEQISELIISGNSPDYSVKIASFTSHGWTEWKFQCEEIEISWETFADKAWFVDWPPGQRDE